VNFGIVPLTFAKESDYDYLSDNERIMIPGIRKALMRGEEIVTAFVKDKEVSLKMNLSQRQRDILLAGGLLPYTVEGRKGK
jgi:aconitate hydratase